MLSLRCLWYLYFALCDAKKINRHLIISSILNPLISYPNQTTFDIGYVEKDYVEILAKYMNFTYDVAPPSDVLVPGFIVNGSWTGMIGQLQRREVDMGVTLTDDSHAKYSVVDVTFAVQHVGAAIIIPRPYPGFKTYLLRAPFTAKVWLLFWITAIVIILMLWATSLDLRKLSSVKNYVHSLHLIGRLFFVYLGIFTNQDFYLRNKRNSFRLMFATFLLTSLVLSNLYTSVFTSRLAVPYFKVVANSIEEVAKNENIRVHAYNSSGTTDYVLGAKSGYLKQLGKQWSKYPRQLVGSEMFEMTKIVRGNHVFITTDSVAENYVETAFNKYKYCRIALAREKFYERGQSVNLPKGSYLTPLLNEQILRMKQAGLVEYAVRSRQGARRNACKMKRNNPDNQLVKILMEDLSGAFVLLLFGYSVSLVAFILEFVISRF